MFIVHITNFNIQPSAFLTLIPFIYLLIISGTRNVAGSTLDSIFKMPPHKCEMCDKRAVKCVIKEASMKHMKNVDVSVGQGIYSTLGDTPDLQSNSLHSNQQQLR